MALRRQLAHSLRQKVGLGEDVAYDEHQQRPDALGPRAWENDAPGVLVHQVEGEHDHLPARILERSIEHGMVGIAGGRLGNAEVAQLALGLLGEQRRNDIRPRRVECCRRHPVQHEHVDVVGPQVAQRLLEARHDLGRGLNARSLPVAAVDVRLGRDNDLGPLARPECAAKNRLGTIKRRRVEISDTEVERGAHQINRFCLAFSCAEPDAAVPAAAEAGYGNL